MHVVSPSSAFAIAFAMMASAFLSSPNSFSSNSLSARAAAMFLLPFGLPLGFPLCPFLNAISQPLFLPDIFNRLPSILARPMAFAVFKFMTNSCFVGACTGRSAGSPLRIRLIGFAARRRARCAETGLAVDQICFCFPSAPIGRFVRANLWSTGKKLFRRRIAPCSVHNLQGRNHNPSVDRVRANG